MPPQGFQLPPPKHMTPSTIRLLPCQICPPKFLKLLILPPQGRMSRLNNDVHSIRTAHCHTLTFAQKRSSCFLIILSAICRAFLFCPLSIASEGHITWREYIHGRQISTPFCVIVSEGGHSNHITGIYMEGIYTWKTDFHSILCGNGDCFIRGKDSKTTSYS